MNAGRRQVLYFTNANMFEKISRARWPNASRMEHPNHASVDNHHCVDQHDIIVDVPI